MLRLATVSLVIAVIAGFFGFPLLADYSWVGAKIIFFIFISLTMVFFGIGTYRMWSYGDRLPDSLDSTEVQHLMEGLPMAEKQKYPSSKYHPNGASEPDAAARRDAHAEDAKTHAARDYGHSQDADRHSKTRHRHSEK